MTTVLQLTSIKSKRVAVGHGLKALLALKQQEQIKQFKGVLHWEGDLERMKIESYIVPTLCVGMNPATLQRCQTTKQK